MKALLTITLTFCLSVVTLAQDDVNLKEMVGFGCYYEGRSTMTVIKMTRLLEAKKYKDIATLLASKNTGEKYLAVISLQRLADLGQYKLSRFEKDLISQAKLSEDLVSVCSGCTYFDEVPMKTMLSENDIIGSGYWLDQIIKED